VFNVAGLSRCYQATSANTSSPWARTTSHVSPISSKRLDGLWHLISEHNTPDANAFSQSGLGSLHTLQGPKNQRTEHAQHRRAGYHVAKPLYALEPPLAGNLVGIGLHRHRHPQNGFVLNDVAAALNFGDMTRNSSSASVVPWTWRTKSNRATTSSAGLGFLETQQSGA